MIIFTNNLICVPPSYEVYYFNLASYICYNGVSDISVLMPSHNLLDQFPDPRDGIDTTEFDNLYFSEVINTPEKFTVLINLMNFVYNHPDVLVVILIEDGLYCNSVKLSFIRLIQLRYGYPCYCLETSNDTDDLMYILSQHPDFTCMGSTHLIGDNMFLLNDMNVVQSEISRIENDERKENMYATQKGRLPLPSEKI